MDMKKLYECGGDRWAILESALTEECMFEEYKVEPVVLGEMAGPGRKSKVRGKVVSIPLRGVLTPRAEFGGTSTVMFGRVFDSLVADPSIGAIVLEIDSPGGSVVGTEELGDRVAKASNGSGKKIIAIANTDAMSAAFWIGVQAQEFFVTPSGGVGSIGVIAIHTDFSAFEEQMGVKTTVVTTAKNKAEFSPFGPLSDEAMEHLKEELAVDHKKFVKAVADGRGVTPKAVEEGFGQGRTFGADAAKSRGMVDGIKTFDEVIGELVARQAEPNDRGRRSRRIIADAI